MGPTAFVTYVPIVSPPLGIFRFGPRLVRPGLATSFEFKRRLGKNGGQDERLRRLAEFRPFFSPISTRFDELGSAKQFLNNRSRRREIKHGAVARRTRIRTIWPANATTSPSLVVF